MLNQLSDEPSSAISGWAALSVAAAVVALMAMYRASDDGFIPLLDHANLAFHEAGHVFFGILGSTLGLYGGTLGQLVFPVVVTVSFLRKGSLVAAAFGLLWFFQNFLNIARYVADARTQALPLVGGGDHDWTQILARWRALPADTSVARTLTVVAWIGMVATILWMVVAWRRNRSNS